MATQPDTFTSHVPALLASATATLIATFGLSYLGYAGTLAGLVCGSLITGGAAWWLERWYRRTAAVAKAKAEAVRRRGRPLTDTETHMITRVVDAKQPKVRGIPWKLMTASAVVVLLAVAAVILIVEAGTGKPVSAVVRGNPGHGFFAPVPAPTVTVTQAPSFSPSPTFSRSPKPTVSPTPTPSASTSSPVPSTIPPSPSATPTTVPTPSPSLPIPSTSATVLSG